MALDQWQKLLDEHFSKLGEGRSAPSERPIFALEHGLDTQRLRELEGDIRDHVGRTRPSAKHWLPWVVYAAEIGYRYDGHEYWQTFEAETPGWTEHGERHLIRRWYERFEETYGAAKPEGDWAKHFTIICWPITHAILPKDLQQQFARVLFDLSNVLDAEVLNDAGLIGDLVSSRSYGASRRFQYFAQSRLLTGQIAAALLAPSEERRASPRIMQRTLDRIVEDLSAERSSRSWLKRAQQRAQRIRLMGLSRPGRAGDGSSERRRSQQAGAAALAVQPRLRLRPSAGGHDWTAELLVPDFTCLMARFSFLEEPLVRSRFTVSCGRARPFPGGALLQGGRTFKLIRFPRSGEPLLKFDHPTPELDELIRADSATGELTNRLFRIHSDGIAREVRGRQVQPRRTYIIVSEAPLQNDDALTPVSIDCDNSFAALYLSGEVISDHHVELLEDMGLRPAKRIKVWPTGLPAADWDQAGYATWVRGHPPLIGVQVDYSVDELQILLTGDQVEESISLAAPLIGAPNLLQLPLLHVGAYSLKVTAIIAGEAEIGDLEFVVREPRIWTPGKDAWAVLRSEVYPLRPTLEQLWEDEVSVAVHGPLSRKARCDVSLISDGEKKTLFHRAWSMPFPIDTAAWRDSFERHFLQQKEAQRLYDGATMCRIEFSAVTSSEGRGSAIECEEFGRLTLECERDYTPLRWIARSVAKGTRLNLIDDTGSLTPAKVHRRSFATPLASEKIAADEQGIACPPEGGMYVATASSSTVAVITPPKITGLDTLKFSVELPAMNRTVESAQQLLAVIEQWATARLTGCGDVFAARRRREVLDHLQARLFEVLGGSSWARAEAPLRNIDLVPAARARLLMQAAEAISKKQGEGKIARALLEWDETDAGESTQERFHFFFKTVNSALYLDDRGLGAQRSVAGSDRSPREHAEGLVELALRSASRPSGVSAWAGASLTPDLTLIIQDIPVLARAARFFALWVDHQVRGDRPVEIGARMLGWEWGR